MNSFSKLASAPPVILKQKDAENGRAAWQMQWPVPPGTVNFLIHEGHLLGAANPTWMRKWTETWNEPTDSLAKDGEVFRKVMKGMTGGETDSLALLVYGDLRAYLPLLTAFAAGMDILPDGLFQTNPMPDLKKLGDEFSGIALALRRDRHGVALVSFGPTGGFVSFVAVAPIFFWTAGMQVAQAGAVPVPVR
jgi:hypothetical protein